MNVISESQQLEIPLSRIKMTLLFLGALVFVILGLWLIFGFHESSLHSYSRYSYVKNPVFRFSIGICVIFFGLCAVNIFIKLLDKKPGLIINEKGIVDNSNFVGLDFIPWKDIKDIKKIKVNNGNFILVLLKNPSHYINSTTHWLKRKSLRTNFKYHNTPICMSANSLPINFDELYQLLVNNMKKFKK